MPIIRDDEKIVSEMIKRFHLEGLEKRYPRQLSGGQQQRVGIARAIVTNPDFIISDEATSALDPQTTIQILDLLKEINTKSGITILMITHELDAIRYICNRMAVPNNNASVTSFFVVFEKNIV